MRNRIGWRQRLSRFQGSSIELDLSAYDLALTDINRLEDEIRSLTDADLDRRARELTERARSGASLGNVRSECFALAREASRRALGQRPFDVQVLAGLALDRGSVVEMQTGEGKTLAAVHAGGTERTRRLWRPCADLQRLSGPPATPSGWARCTAGSVCRSASSSRA